MFMLYILVLVLLSMLKNLVDYKGLDFILLVDESSHEPIFERPSLPPLQGILPNTAHKVDKILDYEIITTSDVRLKDIWSIEKRKHRLMIHGLTRISWSDTRAFLH